MRTSVCELTKGPLQALALAAFLSLYSHHRESQAGVNTSKYLPWGKTKNVTYGATLRIAYRRPSSLKFPWGSRLCCNRCNILRESLRVAFGSFHLTLTAPAITTVLSLKESHPGGSKDRIHLVSDPNHSQAALRLLCLLWRVDLVLLRECSVDVVLRRFGSENFDSIDVPAFSEHI